MSVLSDHLEAHYAVYDVAEAAGLLTDNEDERERMIEIMHYAIENGHLKCLKSNVMRSKVKIIPRFELKRWVLASNPPELPSDLFDEAERRTGAMMSISTFNDLSNEIIELKADRDKYKLRLREALASENKPAFRILGAIIKIFCNKQRLFTMPHTQAGLTRIIIENYTGFTGLRRRTIEKYFAIAVKAINQLEVENGKRPEVEKNG